MSYIKAAKNIFMNSFFLKTVTAFFLMIIGNVALGANKDSAKLKLFLSDSLTIQNSNGNILADPFTGGIESPRFFNMELNGDNKPDLVIFDRKNNKVNTYLNEGSVGDAVYRHSPAFEHLFPRGRNNYYLVDMDRDGFLDIICGDIFQNRLIFYQNKGLALPNLEFENRGLLEYLHYSPPSPGARNYFGNPSQHIPALADVDNDGDIDILSVSSFGGNLEYYENRQADSGLSKDSLHYFLVDICYGHFKEGFANEVLIGQCNTDKYYTRRHAAGSSLLLLDLDKDGDKDLLLSNSGFKNMISLINGYEEYNAAFDSMISWDSIFPRNTQRAIIEQFPSASLADINGDGVNDLIVSPTFNGSGPDEEIKGTNQTMLYINNGANDSFDLSYQGNNFLMSQSIDLGANASPCFYDYDGDGDYDLFVVHSGNRNSTLGRKDQIALFKNIGNKSNPILKLTDMNFGNFSQFNLTYSHLAITDFDDDGKYEFYLGQLGGEVHQYTFSGGNQSPTFALKTNNFVGTFSNGEAAVSFLDYNKDGKKDIVLGSYTGEISLFENTGTNQSPSFTKKADKYGKMFTNVFTQRTNPPSFEGVGRSNPLVVDMNGDGESEIISGSISGKIFAWKPTTNLTDSFEQYEGFINYLDAKDDTLKDYWFGSSTTVAAADLDNDTITDLIVFNNAGGFHYLSGKARKFVVSTKYLKQFSSNIYPNPTNTLINITGLPINAQTKIRLYDIKGKLILEIDAKQTSETILLDHLLSGIYLVQISAEGYQTSTKRIVKLDN